MAFALLPPAGHVGGMLYSSFHVTEEKNILLLSFKRIPKYVLFSLTVDA